MKFVLSYSGGKDSILASYRAINSGHELVALLTTWNKDQGESHFHRLPEALLQKAAKEIGVPLVLIKTDGEDYNQNFEAALTDLKKQGAEAVVFGDIDVPGHLEWGRERCRNTGLEALFPLFQEERRKVVDEFIDAGFKAVIKVVDPSRLDSSYVGKTLTYEILDSLEKEGVDVCGENGEYHTFVYDGPMFQNQVF